MTINAGEFLIAFVAAMGIPSAIMGLIVWKLERKIAARDKRAEEQDEAQKDFFLLMVQSTGANIKHKQKDFLTKQGIHALYD